MSSDPRATHLVDQIEAAATEAERTLHSYAALTGGTYGRVRPTPWLQGLIRRAISAAVDGQVRYCPHVGPSPMPIFTAAHRLGDVSCARCFGRQGDATRGTDEDRTCDVCRNVVDRIHPDGIAAGPLTITYGACRSCLWLVRGTPHGGPS